jgi:hypothetical protein
LDSPTLPNTGMTFMRLFSSSMPSTTVRLKIGKSQYAASPASRLPTAP